MNTELRQLTENAIGAQLHMRCSSIV